MTAAGPLVGPEGLVTVYPPTAGDPYFRMTWRDSFNRRHVVHVGKDLDRALRRAESQELLLLRQREAPLQALPTAALFDAYLNPNRPKFSGRSRARGSQSWSLGYTESATRAFSPAIRDKLGKVPLSELRTSHVLSQVNELGSAAEAGRFLRFLRSAVSYGLKAGLLRQDQARIYDVEISGFPQGRRTRERWTDAPVQGEDLLSVSPERTPTDIQVADLGNAAVRYPYWKGLVETLAYCGPRIHEAIDLRADDVQRRSGSAIGSVEAPLDDGATPIQSRLRISKQAIEAKGGHTSGPTKNGRPRRVTVPERTPTGFELAAWLEERSQQSVAEQQAGTNPLALLFPAPRGDRWWLRNLRRDLFDVAAEQAGWPTETLSRVRRVRRLGATEDITISRRMWLHPLHSLRHRFATTALNDWNWSGVELCAQGGWESPEFVYRHYVGVTEDHLDSAAAKQRAHLRAKGGGR